MLMQDILMNMKRELKHLLSIFVNDYTKMNCVFMSDNTFNSLLLLSKELCVIAIY